MFLKALFSLSAELVSGAIAQRGRAGHQNLEVAGDEGEASDFFFFCKCSSEIKVLNKRPIFPSSPPPFPRTPLYLLFISLIALFKTIFFRDFYKQYRV